MYPVRRQTHPCGMSDVRKAKAREFERPRPQPGPDQHPPGPRQLHNQTS